MKKTIYNCGVGGLLACLCSGVACATDAFSLIGNGPISVGMGGAVWPMTSEQRE
ncbi:hypothetical secreted protein [Pseudomonas veronii 1YdBTEX2]|uniref:Hypothetical secreted protein n=1 Tax=Pseudomonas veronii 1YdBTEX2 TaxID=1295141 RepID=A0A1D3K8L6_PSEVE|nr:hypothetical secreted protein [Pseudomonas veronii 1YdBTEX2]